MGKKPLRLASMPSWEAEMGSDHAHALAPGPYQGCERFFGPTHGRALLSSLGTVPARVDTFLGFCYNVPTKQKGEITWQAEW